MWQASWRSAAVLLLACSTAGGQWSPPPLKVPEPVWGQPVLEPNPHRLPLVTETLVDGQFASQSLPQYFREPLSADEELLARQLAARESPPPGTRNGVFQKLQFSGTWIPALEEGDLGWSDLDAWVVLGFPFPRRETPLVVTPGFAVHYLDGPTAPDLPPRLYDAWVEWRHLRQLSEAWAMDVSVTTGYYSDFEADDGDAFRLTGRGVGVYTWSPITKVVFGAGYFNRAAARVLPVGGLLITPNESTRWELIFPAPRVAWRLDWLSLPGVDERWVYIAGEFGGGVWAIERADGMHDKLDSTDIRVLFGVERKQPGAIGSRFEVGYVFGREIEFDSGVGNFEPEDTLLLRFALTY